MDFDLLWAPLLCAFSGPGFSDTERGKRFGVVDDGPNPATAGNQSASHDLPNLSSQMVQDLRLILLINCSFVSQGDEIYYHLSGRQICQKNAVFGNIMIPL